MIKSCIKTSYFIKIPSNISIFYCDKKKIIVFLGPKFRTFLKLKVKVFLSKKKKLLKISALPFKLTSNINKKILKSFQGTTYALIRQKLIESCVIFYKKLLFVGVGYRLSIVESSDNKLISLKLGLSHLCYFKVPKNLKIFSKKRTELFIFSNSYYFVTQCASTIRLLKKPEPYKGKGILYENEKVVLKEGKKI